MLSGSRNQIASSSFSFILSFNRPSCFLYQLNGKRSKVAGSGRPVSFFKREEELPEVAAVTKVEEAIVRPAMPVTDFLRKPRREVFILGILLGNRANVSTLIARLQHAFSAIQLRRFG